MVTTSHMGLWSPYNVASVGAGSRANSTCKKVKAGRKSASSCWVLTTTSCRTQAHIFRNEEVGAQGRVAGSNSTQAGPSQGAENRQGWSGLKACRALSPVVCGKKEGLLVSLFRG